MRIEIIQLDTYTVQESTVKILRGYKKLFWYIIQEIEIALHWRPRKCKNEVSHKIK